MGKVRFEQESKTYHLPEMRDVTNGAETAFDKLLKSYPMYWGQDASVWQATKYVLQHNPADVFACVFRIVDVSCHFYWCFLPLNIIEEARAKEAKGTLTKDDIRKLDEQFSEIVGPVYEYADKIVGSIVEQAAPGSTFIIVSDHGFGYYKGSWSHTTQPQPPDGVLVLSGGPYKKGIQIQGASIYDITPTLLYQLHLPVANDMDGKILASAFSSDFTSSYQIARIKTWETGTAKGEQAPIPTENDQEILEDLRSLGYIQ
jgi:hypothetical protein